MKLRFLQLACVLLLLGIAESTHAQTPTPTPVADRAMGILKNNCFACHNPEKKKGHLDLTTQDLALRGDDDGPVIISGKPAESRLLAALSADADPHMPPKVQLDADQIAALGAWVRDGAQWNEKALAAIAPTTRPVTLHALPSSYQPVLAIALSPDQKQLAIGRRDRIYIHDLSQPTRPLMRVLEGTSDAVRSLAWSKDSRWLAAGGYRAARVWPMQSREEPLELGQIEGRVTTLCFIPDNESLLAADQSPGGPGKILLYHLPDPQPHASVIAHGDAIFSLQCSSDGNIVASASADKLVKLWDASSLKELARLEGHTSPVLSLVFSSDNAILASGAADRDVKLWDVKTHEQKTTIGPHLARVNALAWPAANTLFAAGDDGSIRVDNDSSKSPGQALTPAEDTLYCIAATADGKTIYAGCHDGKVYVWSGRKPQPAIDEK